MLASNTISARNARPCAKSAAGLQGRVRMSIHCAAKPARHVRTAHGPASPPEPRAKPALLTQATVQMAPSTMIPSLLHQKASEGFEFLASYTERISEAQKLWQARESATAVVSPATAAEAQAAKVQETNVATECMIRALQHTNTNLARQLREERAERLLMKVRLERLKAGFSPKSDVSCDPAMERQIQHMIKAQEMQAMERQLATMRHEMTVLRAQLEACKGASPRA